MNLYDEIAKTLKAEDRNWRNIQFVKNKEGLISIAEFAQAAKDCAYDEVMFEYQRVIDPDLKIVGLYWWLERGERNGKEQWIFKKSPKIKNNELYDFSISGKIEPKGTKHEGPINLYEETMQFIEENAPVNMNVSKLKVQNDRGRVPLTEYFELAKEFNYDNQIKNGETQVDRNLVLVQNGDLKWWISRGEKEGKECWDSNKKPDKPTVYTSGFSVYKKFE